MQTEQIKRMIKDRKFNRFLADFAEQWFELPRQDEIAVDKRVYKNFNLAAKPAMKQETIKFSNLCSQDQCSDRQSYRFRLYDSQ